jgi:AcrR family transcriptional regulator
MKSSVAATAADSESEMRSRILRAAFHAFTENGYAGTSTLQIATRAKVSKRDLYAMFENKQAMLLACIRTHSDKMRLPAGLPAPGTREALAETLTEFGATLIIETSHPAVVAMFRLAISEAERAPEVAKAIHACREAARRTVSDLVIQAQARGLLSAGQAGEMADRFLALVREDLMMSLLLAVAARPSRAKIEQRAGTATRIFLDVYGVSNAQAS